MKIFVPLSKRKENSEFWWAENRLVVSKRGFGGEFASFEGFFCKLLIGKILGRESGVWAFFPNHLNFNSWAFGL